MARNITRTDFGAPRKAEAIRPTIPECGHVDAETGECCPKAGSFGRGPPRHPVSEWRCLDHVWKEFLKDGR